MDRFLEGKTSLHNLFWLWYLGFWVFLSFSLFFFLFLFLFWGRILYVAQVEQEFVVLLHPPQCWNHSCTTPDYLLLEQLGQLAYSAWMYFWLRSPRSLFLPLFFLFAHVCVIYLEHMCVCLHVETRGWCLSPLLSTLFTKGLITVSFIEARTPGSASIVNCWDWDLDFPPPACRTRAFLLCLFPSSGPWFASSSFVIAVTHFLSTLYS